MRYLSGVKWAAVFMLLGASLLTNAQGEAQENMRNEDPVEPPWVIVIPSAQPFPFALEPGDPDISEPAFYHEYDAPAASQDKGWLALVEYKGVWALEPARMQVTRTHDSMLDRENSAPSGAIVSSPDNPNALALLQHSSLRAGVVEAQHNAAWSVLPLIDLDAYKNQTQFDHNFMLNGKSYRLELQTRRFNSPFNGDTLEDHLALRDLQTNKAFAIYTEVGAFSSTTSVEGLWVGDLDRDGLPDLILWLSSYNSLAYCLYLSSHTKTGGAPEKVGCQSTTGC